MEGTGLTGESFRKCERLVKTAEFDRVFAEKTSAAGKYIIVYAMPNDRGFPRLGLKVGKKAGDAVRRNLIKRRFREIFRKNKTAADGLDVVMVPIRGVLDADFSALAGDYVATMRKIGTIVAKKYRSS